MLTLTPNAKLIVFAHAFLECFVPAMREVEGLRSHKNFVRYCFKKYKIVKVTIFEKLSCNLAN